MIKTNKRRRKPNMLINIQYRLMIVISTILSLASISTAATETNNANEFQYQTELIVDKSKNIQLLLLPESVQSKLNFANVTDVQVYNADGLMLPSYAKFNIKKATYSESIKMNFFPLYADVSKPIEDDKQQQVGVKLEVLLNTHIQIVNDKRDADNAGKTLEIPRVYGYIIENPQYNNGGRLKKSLSGNFYQLDIDLKNKFEGIASLKIETRPQFQPTPLQMQLVVHKQSDSWLS